MASWSTTSASCGRAGMSTSPDRTRSARSRLGAMVTAIEKLSSGFGGMSRLQGLRCHMPQGLGKEPQGALTTAYAHMGHPRRIERLRAGMNYGNQPDEYSNVGRRTAP